MSLLFLLTQSITAASILTATAVVVTFVTGIEPKNAIVLMVVIVLVYTLMGGMNAVIWTDVLQGVVLFIGAGIVLYNLLGSVSPLGGALTTLAENGKLDPIDTSFDFTIAPTIWAGVFAMTLFHITVYGANQMMVQRALAAKNIGDAKKSYLLMGYAAFFIYFLFFFIGALMYVHFEGREFDQPNEIILVYAQALAIPGLMGVIAAAVLSASMSSLSSAFNSLATITITDFYEPYIKKNGGEKHYLFVSRLVTLLWGLAVIPAAFAFVESKGSILETLTAVGSYFVGAKLAMFGLGFFSRHTTQRGLLVGVAAGFVGIYVLKVGIPGTDWTPPPIAWPWFVVIGGVSNIVVSIAASIAIDGKQSEWHPQTVVGQRLKFERENLPMKENGWYVVPGRAEPITWGLPVFFVFIIGFLLYFATLG